MAATSASVVLRSALRSLKCCAQHRLKSKVPGVSPAAHAQDPIVKLMDTELKLEVKSQSYIITIYSYSHVCPAIALVLLLLLLLLLLWLLLVRVLCLPGHGTPTGRRCSTALRSRGLDLLLMLLLLLWC
ncbi:unnamed protein product [Polarella glacialis]|uniref:Uncharacterized protein n=1 Tax=Polarella glacialis TaxID=89957 RepID=A0A813IUA1_POLGL|nr:unnamed protein product [Polarella glacialis]